MKILRTLVLIAILFPYNALAQNTATDYIVVVDIQHVLQESSAAKDIRDQIKIRRDKYQEDITKQEDDLRKEEQKITDQRNILSTEAFNQKKDEFKEKIIKVQKDVQIKRSSLDEALGASLATVQQSVYEIIDSLAVERQFKIAIPTSQILFADKTLDITGEVLKRLDEKLPTVTVKLDK